MKNKTEKSLDCLAGLKPAYLLSLVFSYTGGDFTDRVFLIIKSNLENVIEVGQNLHLHVFVLF